MTDLAEFLLARIAEDIATARADGVNAFAGIGPVLDLLKQWPDERPYDYLQSREVDRSKRVLAECEAKRRIVEDWQEQERYYRERIVNTARDEHSDGRYAQSLVALGWLGTIYAAHPDYREEWRP